MSVLFPFLSLPSKIPLNTSPKAPLPNKLKDKKHKKMSLSVFNSHSIILKIERKKENGAIFLEITHVLI